MTSRQMYEALLIELNKTDAPNILLEDFNYFANKAINQYINKRYNIYDVNQQTTDDLRVLKATAILPVTKVAEDLYQGLSTASLATYETILPSDYLHILNVICIYKLQKTFKCYNAGQFWRAAAKRLTADAYSLVLDNFWNKPTYKRPYYYIHNVNKDILIPTNVDFTDSRIRIPDNITINTGSSSQLSDSNNNTSTKYTIIPVTAKIPDVNIFSNRSWFDSLPVANYESTTLATYSNFKTPSKNYIVLSKDVLQALTINISKKGTTFIVDNKNPKAEGSKYIGFLEYVGEAPASTFYTFKYSNVIDGAYYKVGDDYYFNPVSSLTAGKVMYAKETDSDIIEELNQQYNNPSSDLSDSSSDSQDTEIYNYITRGGKIVNIDADNLFTTINTSQGEISNVERGGQIRYGNASQVRMEIRYGSDDSVFKLQKVLVDYIKAPQNIRLTQEQLDLTEDSSQMLEYPDYVCQEIINELVHIVMENIGDPKLQTHPIVSLSIANPAQQLTEPVAQPATT